MAAHYFLDAAHSSEDLLTPLLIQHRGWWSRHVQAARSSAGEIVLRGAVTSYHHKQLAQEAFRGEFAATVVRNELLVRPINRDMAGTYDS